MELGKPKCNQSLREKSDNKVGGQQGHEGSTLAFSAAPDEIIIHVPQYLPYCGDDLTQVPAIALSKRRVIHIPKPMAICTEHQTFSKTCSCGHINRGGAGKHKRLCSVWESYRSINCVSECTSRYAIWADTRVL